MKHSKSFDLFIIAASMLSVGIFIGRSVKISEPEPPHLDSSGPASQVTRDFSQDRDIGPQCFNPGGNWKSCEPAPSPSACFSTDYTDDDVELNSFRETWELRLGEHSPDTHLANEQRPT